MPQHSHPTPPPHASDCHCLPCSIGPLVRNHYYTGRLLTAQDFNAEQQYHSDRQRLHNVMLHGWGIVCGLKIVVDERCPKYRLILKPGLAIDHCGREIRVLKDYVIDLRKFPNVTFPEKDAPAFAPGDQDDKAKEDSEAQEEARSPEAKKGASKKEQGAATQEATKEDQATTDEVWEDVDEASSPDQMAEEQSSSEPSHPDDVTLSICIRYAECKDLLQPAPFHECGCPPHDRQPNIIRNHFELEITSQPASTPIPPRRKPPELDDCCEIYPHAAAQCPEAGQQGNCLRLAVITPTRPGLAIPAKSIHHRAYRDLLPSTTTLNHVIECILRRLPPRRLTRVRQINWNHGKRYSYHLFREQFMGEGDNCGFEVTFSKPLLGEPDNLSTRIFEPTVLIPAHDRRHVRIPEFPDGNVTWVGNDKIRLEIRSEYLDDLFKRCERFDLFLRLRCDFLLDRKGRPVDGNLSARIGDDGFLINDDETGDGIPGGLFESWITVWRQLPGKKITPH